MKENRKLLEILELPILGGQPMVSLLLIMLILIYQANSVSLVHNGIIENYIELKNHQLSKGYSFSSETDTEVIAHAD